MKSQNINDDLSIEEVESYLKEYYVEKKKQNNISHNELECDFISI